MTSALIVFARPPVPGRVKTRLSTVLAQEDAAAVYEAFLADALEQYEALDAEVRLYLSEAPEQEPHRSDIYLQSGAGLGERMLRAFAETFAAGYERVVIVGTDHPTLPSAFIEKAFDVLDVPGSVVLGPAEDGGYYLLGTNGLRPELFRGMTYSHGAVFEQTLRRASGTEITVLPMWYDVDTPQQLKRLIDDLAGAGDDCAPRTRRVLEHLAQRYEKLK